MRRLITAVSACLMLASCAHVQPRLEPGANFTYICIPGSAIKRKVADGAGYPAWMVQERGSCLH